MYLEGHSPIFKGDKPVRLRVPVDDQRVPGDFDIEAFQANLDRQKATEYAIGLLGFVKKLTSHFQQPANQNKLTFEDYDNLTGLKTALAHEITKCEIVNTGALVPISPIGFTRISEYLKEREKLSLETDDLVLKGGPKTGTRISASFSRSSHMPEGMYLVEIDFNKVESADKTTFINEYLGLQAEPKKKTFPADRAGEADIICAGGQSHYLFISPTDCQIRPDIRARDIPFSRRVLDVVFTRTVPQ